MNQLDILLTKISEQHHICRGKNESENAWKTRLIYSICGMMAYASLWDDIDEGPISQDHLKKRVHNTFDSYRFMYPELASSLQCESKDLEDEITDEFLAGGIVYQRPHDLIPSMKREVFCDGVLFQRGIAIDDISCVSGLGFYALPPKGQTDPKNLEAMFGLEQQSLSVLWQKKLSSVTWQSNLTFETFTEYLRMKPPFTAGYWRTDPDKTGTVSLLRTGRRGAQLYYLYRYVDNALEVSQLPQWQVEGSNYRNLSCACLSAYGTLPPINYYEDGNLVYLRLQYLLPPRELNFLKLYSWPDGSPSLKDSSLHDNFHRVLSTEVFTAIKVVFSDEGYKFKRGLN